MRNSARTGFLAGFWRLPVAVRLAGLAGAGALAATAAAAMPVGIGVVQGISMAPTLQPGQLFLYAKPDARRTRGLRRGDVVLVHFRGNTLVKRLVALGGDSLWSIDSTSENQSTLLIPSRQGFVAWRHRFPRLHYRRIAVPMGTVYVVGDGICSLDSRQMGPLPAAGICGRVVFPLTPRDAHDGTVRDELPPDHRVQLAAAR